MDFGMYPPEINSGRMYAGPGAAPLSVAAQAWAQLADALYTTASAYESVVTGLTNGAWLGPASVSMTAAATPYVEWLSSTAARVEETAAQATAAVAAYEAAFAATVPPPVIAANRSLLAALAATNFFGQNTPAIAATEAQYAEMWAQDATAMYTYAGSSAAATVLTPLTSPRRNTTLGGQAGQATAVSQAAGAPAGDAQGIASGVAQVSSVAPQALPSLPIAAPAATTPIPLNTLSDLLTVFVTGPSSLVTLGVLTPLDILSGPIDLPFALAGTLVGFHTDDIVSGWNGEEVWPGTGPAPVRDFPATLTNLTPGAVPTVTGGLAQAKAVGALSVPQAWTTSAPEVRPVALASPMTGFDSAAAAPMEVGSSAAFGDVGSAAMTGRAMAGPPSGRGGSSRVAGQRVVARFGSAAPDGEAEHAHVTPRIVVTGVAAKIREITKLRDAGRLTVEEYEKLRKQLLGH
ncbi:PPE family protein [Mycobacterium europaeum]|uniref:PPE family protein n=1 Tax=Mycobacterium europaeum TaxID=761804 RepID=A0A0U1DHZ1_9MYCO|nr:PPE family protein [Mycobacterium europaeum]CQD16653.1 PPE family protein [Mycobacterium europaeum]